VPIWQVKQNRKISALKHWIQLNAKFKIANCLLGIFGTFFAVLICAITNLLNWINCKKQRASLNWQRAKTHFYKCEDLMPTGEGGLDLASRNKLTQSIWPKKILKNILLFIILALVNFEPALAVGFTVKMDGNGDYLTIQDCANDAFSGDTCEVYDGTYEGSVTPPRDGSFGKWINFQAADGNFPIMTGGWNLAGRDYITINGFTCGGIDSKPYSGAAVSNIKVLNNLIHNTYIGIALKGNDVLISGNTFNNMANDMVRQFGDRWTIRNNLVIDETDFNDEHMDFWQSWCSPSGMAASYYLLENNTIINILGGNAHFALVNGTSECSDPTTNSIIRYNKIYNLGSLGSYIDANSATSGSKDNVIYNNTWIKLSEGSFSSWQTYSHNYSASADSSGINNIFYDAMHHSKAKGFNWKSGGSQSYNLYYDPTNIMTVSSLVNSETSAVINQDPLITDPANNDFSLQKGSPAIDKGGPLTNVAAADSGSGTSLIVDKAEFFQPGWGGANPDTIAVGSQKSVALISSIDYNSNTIVLTNPISRFEGDPVYLYRDSDGTRIFFGSAPDIGAVEFEIIGPAVPSGLRVVEIQY
jgi:hypothetical protein